MNNRKLRKAIMTLCAALLLVSLSVGITVAYLTDSDDVVTNTFTIGNVTITMDEAKVDEYGVKDGETRVGANQYKLLPGHNYVKDPTIVVDENSEDCWLFVKVVNGLSGIEAEGETTIAAQMEAKGWEKLVANGAEVAGVYYHEDVHEAGDTVTVFESFTIDGEAVVTDYVTAENEDAKIVVYAYAIQKDGFDTAAAAWEAAPNPTSWN